MLRRLPGAALLLGSIAAAASAQQPIPLFPDAAPPRGRVRPEPLPPLAPGSSPPPGALDTRSPPGAMDTRPVPPASAPPSDTPPAAAAGAAGPAETREFRSEEHTFEL